MLFTSKKKDFIASAKYLSNFVYFCLNCRWFSSGNFRINQIKLERSSGDVNDFNVTWFAFKSTKVKRSKDQLNLEWAYWRIDVSWFSSCLHCGVDKDSSSYGKSHMSANAGFFIGVTQDRLIPKFYFLRSSVLQALTSYLFQHFCIQSRT